MDAWTIYEPLRPRQRGQKSDEVKKRTINSMLATSLRPT
jgi:hypothetical protein